MAYAAGRGALLAVVVSWAAAGPASAQGALTQDEALAVAFPAPAAVERETAFLTDEQVARARRLAGKGVEIEQNVVTRYVAARDGVPLGVAYFDAHRVRTLPEVLMIVVTPEGRVGRIEVLRFSEPPEYKPSGGWLEQFRGRGLERGSVSGGGVPTVTGATLTSRAVSDAVRRTLALHRVLEGGSP